MRWYNDLKIAWKILITISLPVCLAVGLGLYSSSELEKVSGAIMEIEAKRLPSAGILDRIERRINAMGGLAYRHVISTRKEEMRKAQDRMDELVIGIDRDRELYGELIQKGGEAGGDSAPSGEEEELHGAFTAAWGRYMDEAVHITILSAQGRKKTAERLLTGEHGVTFDAVIKAVEALSEYNAGGARDASRSGNLLYRRTRLFFLGGITIILLLGTAMTLVLTRTLNRSLGRMCESTRAVARGDLARTIMISQKDEIGELADAFRQMQRALGEETEKNAERSRRETGRSRLAEAMQGDRELTPLAENILGFFADYFDARTGALYVADSHEKVLTLAGGHALGPPEGLCREFAFGEGAVGQAAKDMRLVRYHVPEKPLGFFRSAMVDCPMVQGVVIPVVHGDKTVCVMELGLPAPFSEEQEAFVAMVMESIAVAVRAAMSRIQREKLVEKTRLQAEALEAGREELKAANVALETRSRYKSEFLANMSHEIRTPMNAILGFSELLEGRLSGDPELKSFVGRIRTGGKNLLTLINDILDLSRIEAGRLDLEPAAMNPAALMEEVGNIFSIQTRKKGLDFRIDVSGDLPRYLFLDEPRLRQVLFNLVGNAVKFTHEGGITGSVASRKGEKEGTVELVLEIRDTGIGIPEKELTSIFEPFRQQEGQSTRGYGGTGLGLTITSRLVERMGGRLRVESSVGKGSVFKVVLPGVRVVNEEPPVTGKGEDAHESPEIELLPATVLLAEDIESNRELVREFLSASPVEIEAVKDGNGVLAAVEKRRFDLILMDMEMPGIPGDEAARRLKGDRRFRDIPIIALTASVMAGEMERAKEYTDSCLGKPVSRSRLLEEMAKFLPFGTSGSSGKNGANGTSGTGDPMGSRGKAARSFEAPPEHGDESGKHEAVFTQKRWKEAKEGGAVKLAETASVSDGESMHRETVLPENPGITAGEVGPVKIAGTVANSAGKSVHRETVLPESPGITAGEVGAVKLGDTPANADGRSMRGETVFPESPGITAEALTARHEKVVKTLSVKGVKSFARDMVLLGKKHENNGMIRGGEALVQAAGMFDVEGMITELAAFPGLAAGLSHGEKQEPEDGCAT